MCHGRGRKAALPTRFTCKFCEKEGDAVRLEVGGAKMTVTLDCGHTCVYDNTLTREKEPSMRSNEGRDVKCQLCADEYRTWFDSTDPFAQFCFRCRTACGITSKRQADAVLEVVDELLAGGGTLCEAFAIEVVKLIREKGVTGAAVSAALTGPVRPAGPKPDPAKVAEAVRMMTGYRTSADTPDPAKTTEYVMAKNGLFEVRRSDIADLIIEAKTVQGLVEEMKPGVRLNIPRMPFEILSQTVAFFREVCANAKGSSEAIVQIFWNREAKAYHIHIPTQRVSGGGVSHESGFDVEGERAADGGAKWLHVADIHSHGSSMSAFWSSVDDGDERKAPEGRLFGVIGKVTQAIPEWQWRMRARDGFVALTVSDIFEVDPAKEIGFTVTWKLLFEMLGAKDGGKDGRVTLSCPVDPFKEATCPPEWHEKVDTKGFVIGGGGAYANRPHSWGGHSTPRGEAAGSSSRSARPALLYVLAPGGRELIEYEVDGGRTNAKPTGVTLPIEQEEGAKHHGVH